MKKSWTTAQLSAVGAPELASAAAKFLTTAMVALATALGGLFGFAGWLVYKKFEKTAVVRRIQGG